MEDKSLAHTIPPPSYIKPNWFSVRLAKNCLFSRRLGHRGKLFLGFSICLRINGKDIF